MTMLRMLTTAGLLAGTAITAAQTQALPPAPAAARPSAASQQKFVALGCISRQPAAPPAAGGNTPAPSFVITDTRGDKPTVYRLEGDPQTLNLHVAHKVEVSGPLSAGTGGNANAVVMKVEKLTYISKECK